MAAETVRATDDALQIYQDRDLGSPVIADIHKGVEIQFGAQTIHEGRQWIEARLADGAFGYVLGPSARAHTTMGIGERADVVASSAVTEQPKSAKTGSPPPANTGSGLTWFDRASMKVMNIVALAVVIFIIRSCNQHH
jgi:hypothetical protein